MPSTSARFIFANLNGTISGWAGGLTSTIKATTPGAVYTGLAINSAGTRLFALWADAGGIKAFDSSFAPVSLPGSFTDPTLPAGFVPFNVQNIGGNVYVTYAPAGHPNQVGATAGMGAVSVFDENGVFQRRLVTGGPLAAPWGLALAPASFGQFGGDLLVGNFSAVASYISAFDPNTGAFKGMIPINIGSGNTLSALWALMFGNGGNGGDPNTLYFTDGINGETNGLFGAIQSLLRSRQPCRSSLPASARWVCLDGDGSGRHKQPPDQNTCSNIERPPRGGLSVCADQFPDVRYWHKADIPSCTAHVGFWSKSGHRLVRCTCLLLTHDVRYWHKADMT